MRTVIIALTAISLFIFVGLQLDSPSGDPVTLNGTLSKGIQVNPRIKPPYTRLFVALDEHDTVVAEGPAGMPIKRNENVELLRYNRWITGRPVYRFSSYLTPLPPSKHHPD